MEFPSCDGVITTGTNGEAICSGAWSAGSQYVALAELSASDIATLLAAGLVTLCIAYGFKLLRKSMGPSF